MFPVHLAYPDKSSLFCSHHLATIVSKIFFEIIEEEFGLNRLVKFEEIMQKGYAKEVVQYLYWARERYEFAVNYIDSISVKYLTDEKDFASMLEELKIINQ